MLSFPKFIYYAQAENMPFSIYCKGKTQSHALQHLTEVPTCKSENYTKFPAKFNHYVASYKPKR